MDIESFDYNLPDRLIAQEPLAERDQSRLMVINRQTDKIEHRHFYDLPQYLSAGDVLVFNDSQVIPARLYGEKRGTGAAIELMLAQPLIVDEGDQQIYDVNSERWLALARPARRLKVGDYIEFAYDLTAEVLSKNQDGSISVQLRSTLPILDAIRLNGKTPLPPYIHRMAEQTDEERYQTVYADKPGSVAAPTAGLHFTPKLIEQCQNRGVQTVNVTLHVGIDTFRPVQVNQVEQHQMHSEWYHITPEAASVLSAARAESRRIICVGTTSVRTLEGASQHGDIRDNAGWGQTDIFIYPGYRFQMVDALVTNFHLPKSTLIMLVSAFYDRLKVLAAYAEAVNQGYRFYSYGDAMLII